MQKGFRELEKPTAKESASIDGQRFLSRDELAALLPNISKRGHGAAARMMLMTGCGIGEACDATWNEIDMERGIWTIPAAHRKDTRSKRKVERVPQTDLVVMLPRQARELLKEIGPAEAGTLIFRGERGAKLQNWDRWTKPVAVRSGISGWDRHALRRTAATMAGELRASPHVIEALLGHRNIGGQLIAGYSKAGYTEDVGTVLQLSRIVSKISKARRMPSKKNGKLSRKKLPVSRATFSNILSL